MNWMTEYDDELAAKGKAEIEAEDARWAALTPEQQATEIAAIQARHAKWFGEGEGEVTCPVCDCIVPGCDCEVCFGCGEDFEDCTCDEDEDDED